MDSNKWINRAGGLMVDPQTIESIVVGLDDRERSNWKYVSRTTRFGEKPSNSNALEGSTKRYFFLSPSLNQESMFSFRGERFEYFKSFEFSNLSLETSIKRFRGDLWILVAKTYLECKIHLGVKLCWNLFSRMETFCRPEITLFKRFNATFATFSCQSTAVLIKKI